MGHGPRLLDDCRSAGTRSGLGTDSTPLPTCEPRAQGGRGSWIVNRGDRSIQSTTHDPRPRHLAALRKKASQGLSLAGRSAKAASTSDALGEPAFSSAAPLEAILGVSFCQSPVVMPWVSAA